MKVTKTWLMLALTGAAFAGPFVSRLLPMSTYAGQPENVPDVLKAHEFQLVDKDGNVCLMIAARFALY